ncbi:MAG: DEAD/DEAH box helicase family protein [Gammaproteobacteria bacterium]
MELKRIDRLISNSKSWDKLFRELSTNKQYTQKFKGDVFERVTQAFLLTIPEYKSILSDVWLNDDVPSSVLKKLNLPSKDFGVDLIAKTIRDEYWTIQCKFKSTNKALTYKELSTFSSLSFVTAKNISLALVVHTSTKPIRNRDFLKNMTEIGAGRWLDLTDDEWDNIRKLCKHKPVKLLKRKPRPHQRDAINAAKKHFLDKNNARGKLIMPCATGKSLAAFWISQALSSRTVIVAVPSLALIKQSLNDWTKEYMANGIVPEWLCICSDESTGKVDIDEFDTDTYDLGIPTTTNKAEIVNFLKRKSNSPKVIFTTYQSSSQLAEAAKVTGTNFDLCILDEAHKTVGAIGKTFSTLLFDNNIKVKKRLFMTATERILKGDKEKLVSMNDSAIYGDYVHVMTFKEAIEENIISDYKLITIAISDSEVQNLIEENRYLSSELKGFDENTAQNLASGIVLKKAFKKYKIKHAISFHKSIALAKQFQAQQDKLNELKSLRPRIDNLHISSKKSSGERAELIKEFTQLERSLLTNARCLTEGIDVPAIDCVMFVDPRQSTVDIVQATGRALRKHHNKSCGYILLPLVVPDEMNIVDFSETTAFKKITSIVAALSSQDERIVEELRVKKRGRSSKGLIIEIDHNFLLGKKIDIEEFSSTIDTKIWEKVARINPRPFEEARNLVRDFNFKNRSEFNHHHSNGFLPLDIPYHPERTYVNDGWVNMGDWLGTNFIHFSDRDYLPFKEARELVRKLNLKNSGEWNKYCSSKDFPADKIPKTPRVVYKDEGWIDMANWLGSIQRNKPYKDRKYKSFKEARKFVRNLGIANQKEWRSYSESNQIPDDIPKFPELAYKDKGYIGLWDWLGSDLTRARNLNYLAFEEARTYVHSLGLKTTEEWKANYKKGNLPVNIPKTPRRIYKDEWISMGDWLGTGKIADHLKIYRPFKDARKFVHSLNLKSGREWRAYANSKQCPDDLPVNANTTYKDKGWISMGDWLGTGNVANYNRVYLPYNEARKFVRNLNLKGQRDWTKYTKSKKLPANIPAAPWNHYKDKGWISIGDWLGIRQRSGNFIKYKDARKFSRNLKLKRKVDWEEYVRQNNLPDTIPKAPSLYYKDKGWIDWKDWLGK